MLTLKRLANFGDLLVFFPHLIVVVFERGKGFLLFLAFARSSAATNSFL
jgi:hypothetical protein